MKNYRWNGWALTDLQPLPLLGIPGVTPDSELASYYDDRWQFRPGRQRA